MQRTVCGEAGFFGVGHDVIRDAAHQCVLEPFTDREFAPLIIHDASFGLAVTAIFFRDIQQAVRCILPAVQDDILNPLAQLLWDVIIDR
jgi:hypothetical protein